MDTGDGHRFSLLVKKPVHAILLIFKQVKHQYNLQHFSYHYHHYNQRCISKFWQVRNLRLPFHYLPKFTFWQVCWLVVFVTCQNFQFWQVCSSDGLFVCVCVCLSVRNFFDTGHSFLYIFTKLNPCMYPCHVTMPTVFLGQRSNN